SSGSSRHDAEWGFFAPKETHAWASSASDQGNRSVDYSGAPLLNWESFKTWTEPDWRQTGIQPGMPEVAQLGAPQGTAETANWFSSSSSSGRSWDLNYVIGGSDSGHSWQQSSYWSN
ncbi:MAG TPA: hypothetical protein VGO93_01975, partial [Candidatus Xenobia bacterium]